MEDLLNNLIDDFITMANEKVVTKIGIWREEPVDILTFTEKYLKIKPYPGKQTECLDTVGKILWWKFTKDPKLCPPELRKVTEFVCLFGKGSGKDFLASIILTYIAYLLCCLNDPHEFFGFGKDEPIDLINIAINAYQANNVFFKKLKARFRNCSWFKRVNRQPEAYNEYQITKNQIRLYKNITAHSAHSEAESFEGFNPLVVIFDEIGGFDYNVAKDCYDTFRSSAVSRFNDKMLMIFISYPRSKEDFIMQKYKEYAEDKDPEVFAMIGKTWEVNIKIKRESLRKDYETDPEGAKMKYECIPPSYRRGLFQFPEKIDQVVEIGKKSQCPNMIIEETINTRTLNNGIQKHYIGLKIHNLELNPQYVYYLGGDGGVNNDSYVISLFHGEPMLITVIENGEPVEKWVNKPVEDLLLKWEPNKKDRLPVDLLNVADIIEMICKKVRVKKALFDKFNSAEVVQRLISFGVEAEDKTFSNQFQYQIYTNLKNLIYSGQICLLDIEEANEELKAIQVINENKIDHEPGKSKDCSDARAAAVWICSNDSPEMTDHFSIPVILGAKLKV